MAPTQETAELLARALGVETHDLYRRPSPRQDIETFKSSHQALAMEPPPTLEELEWLAANGGGLFVGAGFPTHKAFALAIEARRACKKP